MNYEGAICPQCLETHIIRDWTRETDRHYKKATSLEVVIDRFRSGVGDLDFTYVCPFCFTESNFKYLTLIPGSHTNEDALIFLKNN